METENLDNKQEATDFQNTLILNSDLCKDFSLIKQELVDPTDDFCERNIDSFVDLYEPKPIDPLNMNSYHEIGKGPVRCAMCDGHFKQKKSLYRHIRIVHEGERLFQCSLCEYSFSQKTHLSRHIAVVHEGKKSFKCSICDSTFSRKENLNSHLKSVHEEIVKKEEVKPEDPLELFQCSVCSYNSNHSHAVKQHFARVHEGKKPFECPSCEAKFADKGKAGIFIKLSYSCCLNLLEFYIY